MSFKGRVDAECPKCKEKGDFDIWSFVRADDENLKLALIAGDLNVVECVDCHEVFIPDSTVVFADSERDLVAFLFPASYEDERDRWEEKMSEDWEKMRPTAEQMGILSEPLLFFGLEEFRDLLEKLDELEVETQIAQHLSKDIGLSLYEVEPAFARRQLLPRLLPLAPGTGGKFTAKGALLGLHELLDANDRLEGYKRWEALLEKGGEEPPRRKKRKVS